MQTVNAISVLDSEISLRENDLSCLRAARAVLNRSAAPLYVAMPADSKVKGGSETPLGGEIEGGEIKIRGAMIRLPTRNALAIAKKLAEAKVPVAEEKLHALAKDEFPSIDMAMRQVRHALDQHGLTLTKIEGKGLLVEKA